jgi:fumarylpyruvate hydrolase
MAYVFAAPGQAVLPVVGTTDLYPVRRIYCVGRNYAEHAREMGHSERESPFFFGKPADAMLLMPPDGAAVLPFPGQTADLQYEVELVVAIGRAGVDIPVQSAASHVWGHAVGIDLTRRDLQATLKKQGRPWEVAKSFDRSAPVTPIRPANGAGPYEKGRIWLDVNGVRRQESDVAMMIWSIPEIISHLSRYVAVAPGDLVFTGTPAGVSSIVAGDVLSGGVEGIGGFRLEVVRGAP